MTLIKFFLLIILTCSCSYNTYSIHEQNMKVLHDTMIKNDIKMKKKMTNLRIQGVRSYKPKKKIHKKKTIIK